MNTAFRSVLFALYAVACTAAFAISPAYVRIKGSDFGRGYVRSHVATGETHDFVAPGSATCVTRMALRGGATDYVRVHLGTWAFPFGASGYRDVVVLGDGTILFDDGVSLGSALGSLGVVPRDGWGDLPASCASTCAPLGILEPERVSVVWFEHRTDSFVVTWQNALLSRDLARPVSYQAELHRSGRISMRFDLGRVPYGDPVFTAMWRAFGTTRPTTVEWDRLLPSDADDADADGDGVNTERELFDHRTNPRANDTDGDSLYDLPESMARTSSQSCDTDGDGYGDATDPDPLHVTPWDDANGDGFPDAWVERWFGGTAPDPYADAGGDGVGNLASLYIGVRPNTTWALGVQAYQGLLPANVCAVKIVPSAFSFTRPSGLTNLVDRTFRVDRVSPWQQLFVTSDLATYAGWQSDDVELVWEAGGESGKVPENPGWDSYRIPLSGTNTFQSIRFTLRAVDRTASPGSPRLDRPLFLVVWTPVLTFGDDYNVVVSGTDRAPVYLVSNRDSGEYAIPCSVARTGYPHVSGVDADVESALDMPIVPGLSFRGGSLVADGAGRYYLPVQGNQPRVLVVVYHMEWW